RAWLFHHHPKLNPLVRLDTHHQTIGRYAVVMRREYDMWQTTESHNDFREPLRQPFTSAEIERNPRPSPIGDTEFERDEGFRLAVLLADILQIPRTRAAVGETATILATHRQSRDVGLVDALQRFQHFELLVSESVRLERIGRLHRDEAKELHHMVL